MNAEAHLSSAVGLPPGVGAGRCALVHHKNALCGLAATYCDRMLPSSATGNLRRKALTIRRDGRSEWAERLSPLSEVFVSRPSRSAASAVIFRSEQVRRKRRERRESR